VKKLFVNLLEDMFLIVLAGDLLYLYYAGGWYDPFYWIELTEVVLLSLMVAFGLVRLYFHLRGGSRECNERGKSGGREEKA